MEAVHKPSHRAWIDENVINVREWLSEFMKLLDYTPEDYDPTPDELLESLFSKEDFLDVEIDCGSDRSASVVSEEEFVDPEIECGLEALRCTDQDKVEPAERIVVPEHCNLRTVRLQAEDLEKRAKDPKYAAAHYQMMKYCSYPPHKIINLDQNPNLKFRRVTMPEAILAVQIYKPERRLDPQTTIGYAKFPSFHVDQEFYVLGSQCLTELRDKIDCISDKTFSGDVSDCCATAMPSVTCKDLYKSGFFYIGGVFYNDLRHKDCRDYSDVIIKWASQGDRGIGPFKKKRMEISTFMDLTIQLGYPYVYVHQGECEHLIVFTDLRVFSEHDEQNRNAYPMLVQVRLTKRIFCMVCHTFTAEWVVYDNKRLPENPYFFCKTCFFSFNYDSNNQKIGDFKAYYFPDQSVI